MTSCLIYNNCRLKIATALKFVFFFLGTFLHESAHYFFALLLGKAEGFSLLPRREGDNLVFGAVKSRTKFKVLSSFIAASPLLWWAVLFIMMVHFRIIRISGNMPRFDFGLAMRKIEHFSRWDFFYLWIFVQMIWAGKLSGADLKNFFRGFLSVSGLIFIIILAAIIYSYKRFFAGY